MIQYSADTQVFEGFDADEALAMYKLAEALVSPGAADVGLPQWTDVYMDGIPPGLRILAKGSLLPMTIYRSLLRSGKDWIRFLHGHFLHDHWQTEMSKQQG